MAGHLALKGYKVNLYDRNKQKIEALQQLKGVQLIGKIKGFGELALITSCLKDALTGTDIVMIVVPANAHKAVAKACKPYLKEHQIVILNPGRTGGALEFSNVLNNRVTVAETQTLLYACRSLKPGLCHVYGVKKSIPIAAFPGYKISHIYSLIKAAFPQFVSCKNVIETSLSNIGAVFHPTITILNSSRIERKDNFDFYTDGVTKSVANTLEKIDNERLRVAEALKVQVISAKKWLNVVYGSIGDSLYARIHNTHYYKGISAPKTLFTRYIYEDVPTGLVPIANFGKLLGVDTSFINSLIESASIISNKDYALNGRTLFDMGLNTININELESFVEKGGLEDEKETA